MSFNHGYASAADPDSSPPDAAPIKRCSFGVKCTNFRCVDAHPPEWVRPLDPALKCTWKSKCTNPACELWHPADRVEPKRTALIKQPNSKVSAIAAAHSAATPGVNSQTIASGCGFAAVAASAHTSASASELPTGALYLTHQHSVGLKDSVAALVAPSSITDRIHVCRQTGGGVWLVGCHAILGWHFQFELCPVATKIEWT
jgi:hypothetical protein